MKEKKEKKEAIFLVKIYKRIDQGEFDRDLSIPFASRRLLKALIKSKINVLKISNFLKNVLPVECFYSTLH